MSQVVMFPTHYRAKTLFLGTDMCGICRVFVGRADPQESQRT
jgi:hypothetical protein